MDKVKYILLEHESFLHMPVLQFIQMINDNFVHDSYYIFSMVCDKQTGSEVVVVYVTKY